MHTQKKRKKKPEKIIKAYYEYKGLIQSFPAPKL
jgi:hypothetical protein